MKAMKPNTVQSSRLASIVFLGLTVVLSAGLVLMAQHVQPVADKLPAPGRGAPNPGRNVPKPDGTDLKAPAGFTVSVYAENLPSVRNMEYAPNGDLFVSSFQAGTITVLRDGKTVGTFAQRAAAPAGGGAGRGGPRGPAPAAAAAPVSTAAAAIPCTNTELPAGTVGIGNPQGMAFHGGYLYIANADSIVRYKYTAGDTTAQGMPEKIVDLPGTGDHRWRNVVFNAAGTKMYVSIGSASNNDAGSDCRRATIMEFNPDGSGGRIFASGIRNPEPLAWQPGANNVLWTAVNERDNYGDNLPPDYATSVKDGGFYGWPYSYTGQNYDPRYVGGMPDLVKKALVPDVLIEAHSAAIGLAFYTGTNFPQRFRNGAFVALHGSWNSSVAHGYKVIFVPFVNGKPGPTEDFLTGFVADPAMVTKWGRPAGLMVAKDGSLLVADDVGNKIWQIKYTGPAGR
jgi:glucose/arabinose dehydrogenase